MDKDEQEFLESWRRRWLEGLTVTHLARGTVHPHVLRGAIRRAKKWGYSPSDIVAVMNQAQAVAFRPDPARLKQLEEVLSELV